jgi:hypothetical protein
MSDPTIMIPVFGQLQLNHTRNQLREGHQNRIDSSFSIKKPNGSIGAVSSTTDTTLALGAAQLGAMAWMQSGGNRAAYEVIRDDYMRSVNLGTATGALSINTPVMAVFTSQGNNFDRGAATAIGLGLKAYNADNLAIANRALATKIMGGELFNSANEQFTPSIGNNTIQATGYAEAQQQRRATTRSVGVR